MLSLDDLSCARLPRAALPLLASLRNAPGVEAALTEQHAWIRWPVGMDMAAQMVMPIHGAVLFGFAGGHWHRFGEALPAFDFPTQLGYQPLAHVLFPAPVQPVAVAKLSAEPLLLRLKRDEQARQTTALLCPLAALAAWSDTVPTARLTALQALMLDSEVLVLGTALPLLAEGMRFWGETILLPLGWAPDPPLPESALKEVAGLHDDELLLWRPEGAEGLPRTQLSPLTRASIRLAASG